MHICELRVDGYSLIPEVEIADDGTVFIPSWASPFMVDMLFEMRRDDDWVWLVQTLLSLLGKTMCDVKDYVGLMHHDLSMLYFHRRPY